MRVTKRALFVGDRDELRLQGLTAFQNVFGADAAEVYRKPDGTNNARNARIHVATYQTLDVDNEDGTANFLKTFYPPDYFSHIIIDECHRSAWGKWSEILTRNPSRSHFIATTVDLLTTGVDVPRGCGALSGSADVDGSRHQWHERHAFDIRSCQTPAADRENHRPRNPRHISTDVHP